MSVTFTKLVSSLPESTVWCEPYATRIVWVTMLAMADRHGRVWGSVPGLARRSGVTLEECEAALHTFLSPDKHSRTPDNEGRRVAAINGGWLLLNYAKYRAMRDGEGRKQYMREYMANRRNELTSKQEQLTVGHGKPPLAQAEAEAEAERSKPSRASRSVLNGAFTEFWQAYPRKKSKGDAEKAWLKLKPDEALSGKILAAVARAKVSPDWRREGGKFIPYPATWLNAKGWEDEQTSVVREPPRLAI